MTDLHVSWWCRSCGVYDLLDHARVCQNCRLEFIEALGGLASYHMAEAASCRQFSEEHETHWGNPDGPALADAHLHERIVTRLKNEIDLRLGRATSTVSRETRG